MSQDYRARVRMYRHGFGDCFLVSLPRTLNGQVSNFWIMIDCGTLEKSEAAKQKMRDVVQNIEDITGGTIDLLIVTHEHWDHLSGFVDCKEKIDCLTFKEVWMGWTEDETDPTARLGANKRWDAIKRLQTQEHRLQLAGMSDQAESLGGFLGFFNASGGKTTKDALNKVKEIGRKAGCTLRYWKPETKPGKFDGVSVRFWILGPPTDPGHLCSSSPRKNEGYGMDGLEHLLARTMVDDGDGGQPFHDQWRIPWHEARSMPFFRQHYWGMTGREEALGWRSIDSAWVDDGGEMALNLDHATNNTSLVVAMELRYGAGGKVLKDDEIGDVLLFTGDAQAGSWRSWQGLQWTLDDGIKVTGPELLANTVLYKVGHHGSHNATMRKDGLERMQRLSVAMLPVDRKIAAEKGWDRIPLPNLLHAMGELAGRGVVIADEDMASGNGLENEPLWYEYQL